MIRYECSCGCSYSNVSVIKNETKEHRSVLISTILHKHVQCSYIIKFKPFCTGVRTVIWSPLRPKKLIHYCRVRILLDACIREILCDVSIICQESHYVTALDKCHCKS